MRPSTGALATVGAPLLASNVGDIGGLKTQYKVTNAAFLWAKHQRLKFHEKNLRGFQSVNFKKQNSNFLLLPIEA